MTTKCCVNHRGKIYSNASLLTPQRGYIWVFQRGKEPPIRPFLFYFFNEDYTFTLNWWCFSAMLGLINSEQSYLRWTVLRTWYKCLYWCWYYLNAESLWSCKSVCKYYFLFVAVVHDFRKWDRIKYICIYILIQMTCLLGRESLDMSVSTVCILCTVCDEHVFFFFF